MRPELLTTESLRDYVLALPDRDKWEYVATAYCPRQIMAEYRNTPCDLYVVLPNKAPICESIDDFTDIPVEVIELNRTFFCTDNVGLTPRQAVWWVQDMHILPYPALVRLDFKSWHEMHMNRRVNNVPLGKLWWDHPARRRYSRLVIVPRETA